MVTKRKPARKSNKKTLSPASYVKASLSYVAEHKHTGKKLAHHHTSHGALLIFLIIAGIALFFSLASLQANGVTKTKSGQVQVTATVAGTPPNKGAVIKTPSKNSSMTQSLTQVNGTCPSTNTVAVYNNGIFSGSTTCTTSDTFQATIQLNKGPNTIQAQNYDQLNQPGPATEQINIAYEPVVTDESASTPPPAQLNTEETITIDPTIPNYPAPQPSARPCYEEPANVPSNENFGVLVSCVTRNTFIGEQLELPITLYGGIGPYALSVDWGDSDSSQLYSFQESGPQTLAHTYKIKPLRTISLKLADAQGQTYQIETVVQVSGEAAPAGLMNPITAITEGVTEHWVEASVPVYWGLVAIFLGFWIGDLFQRFFGKKKTNTRRHV